MGFFKKLVKGDVGGIVNDAIKDVGNIVGAGGSNNSGSNDPNSPYNIAVQDVAKERYLSLGGKYVPSGLMGMRPKDLSLYNECLSWARNTPEGQALVSQKMGGASSSNSVVKDVANKVVNDALSGAGNGFLNKAKDFVGGLGNSLTKGLGGTGANLIDDVLKEWWKKNWKKVLLIGVLPCGILIYFLFKGGASAIKNGKGKPRKA